MVGASKILTVSYGTFSCTLEGFDEPFSTMKAIAEYFRDLAADDRYFGAEPPTPDAEMLHRIAEREIQRRVEAKIGANGIVLRPQDRIEVTAPATGSAPQPSPQPSVIASAPRMPAAAPQAPMPADAARPEPVTPAAQLDESVAAKLQRIRAAVASARAANSQGYGEDQHAEGFLNGSAGFGFAPEMAAPLGTTEGAVAEAGAAKPSAEPTPAPVDAVLMDRLLDDLHGNEAGSDTDPGTEAAIDAAFDADEAMAVIDPTAEEATAEFANTAFDAESADDAAQPQSAGSAPAIAPRPGLAQRAEALIGARAQRRAIRAAALVAAAAELVQPAADDEQPLAEEPAAELPAEAVVEGAEAVDPGTVAPDVLVLGSEDAAPRLRARVIKVHRIDPDLTPLVAAANDLVATDEMADDAADIVAERDDEDDLMAAIGMALDATPQTSLDAAEDAIASVALSPEAEAELMRELAQVEYEQADATDSGLEAEVTVEIAAAGDPETVIEAEIEAFEAMQVARWDDEAEAEGAAEHPGAEIVAADAADTLPELADLAELAPADDAEPDLAQDLAADDQPITDIVGDEAGEQPAPEARDVVRHEDLEPEEADMSRLLRETNSKLEGTENRRRFSAIAHLKAAVAATVADRKMRAQGGPVAPAEEAMDRYRDDLTRAVRPRRPTSSGEAATQRPALPDARPAPLVLVSEQRIDRDDDTVAPSAPVIRPRRISTAELGSMTALASDDDTEDDDDTPISPDEARSFADFAESLGAAQLSDLLEAAAAYTATVEGRPHFSRPQIIKKVAALAEDGNYNREAGLRTFGLLLRQGKIAKIKRGQFAITEQSRFYGDARRATR